MAQRQKGRVKWFASHKGYGMIEGEDAQLYFVHYREIKMEGFRDLKEAQLVSFVADPASFKGPRAVEVEVLECPS